MLIKETKQECEVNYIIRSLLITGDSGGFVYFKLLLPDGVDCKVPNLKAGAVSKLRGNRETAREWCEHVQNVYFSFVKPVPRVAQRIGNGRVANICFHSHLCLFVANVIADALLRLSTLFNDIVNVHDA